MPITPNATTITDNLIGKINYLLDQANGGNTITLPQSTITEAIRLNPYTQNLVVVKTKDDYGMIVSKALVHDNNDISSLGKILTYIHASGKNYIGSEILTPYHTLYLSREDILNNLVVCAQALTEKNSSIPQNKLLEALSHVLVSEEIDQTGIEKVARRSKFPEDEHLKYEIIHLLKKKAEVSKKYFLPNSKEYELLNGLKNYKSIESKATSTEPADIFEAEIQRWRRDAPKMHSNLGFAGLYTHLLAMDTYESRKIDMTPFNAILAQLGESPLGEVDFQEQLQKCTRGNKLEYSLLSAKGDQIKKTTNGQFKKLFQAISFLANAHAETMNTELISLQNTLSKKSILSELDYQELKERAKQAEKKLAAMRDLETLAIKIGGPLSNDSPIKQKTAPINDSLAIYSAILDMYPLKKVNVSGIYAGNKEEIVIHPTRNNKGDLSLKFDAAPSLTPMQEAFDNQVGERITQMIELKGLDNMTNAKGLSYLLRQSLYLDAPSLGKTQANLIITKILSTLMMKKDEIKTQDQKIKEYYEHYLDVIHGSIEEKKSTTKSQLFIDTASLYTNYIQNELKGSVKSKPVSTLKIDINPVLGLITYNINEKLIAYSKQIERSNLYQTSLAVDQLNKNKTGFKLFEFYDYLVPIFSHQAEWADPTIAACYQKTVDYNENLMDKLTNKLVQVTNLHKTQKPEVRSVLNDLYIHRLNTSQGLNLFFTGSMRANYTSPTAFDALKSFFSNYKNEHVTLDKIKLSVSFKPSLESMQKGAIVSDMNNENHWVKFNAQKIRVPVFKAADIDSSKDFRATEKAKNLVPNIKVSYIRNRPIVYAQQGKFGTKDSYSFMKAVLGEELETLNDNKYKLLRRDVLEPKSKNPTAYFLIDEGLTKRLKTKFKNLDYSPDYEINVLNVTHNVSTINNEVKKIDNRNNNLYFVPANKTNDVINDLQSFIENTVQNTDRELLIVLQSLHGDYGQDIINTNEKEGICKKLSIQAGSSKDPNAAKSSYDTNVIYTDDLFKCILRGLQCKNAFINTLEEKHLRIRLHLSACLVGSASLAHKSKIGLTNDYLPNDSFIDRITDNLHEILREDEELRKSFKNLTFEITGSMTDNLTNATETAYRELSMINTTTGQANELAQSNIILKNGTITRTYKREINPSELHILYGSRRLKSIKMLSRQRMVSISSDDTASLGRSLNDTTSLGRSLKSDEVSLGSLPKTTLKRRNAFRIKNPIMKSYHH